MQIPNAFGIKCIITILLNELFLKYVYVSSCLPYKITVCICDLSNALGSVFFKLHFYELSYSIYGWAFMHAQYHPTEKIAYVQFNHECDE